MDLSFEAWINHVFDHPVAEPKWYWDSDAEFLDEPPTLTVAYMTRLFENAQRLLGPFSNEQINQGLWYLAGDGSGYSMAMMDPLVPWPDRRRCIHSIYTLFERFFVQRCSHVSSHRDADANPLNLACFMWWDILLPYDAYGNARVPTAEDEVFLSVLERTLQIDSEVCQESALHGIGHWQMPAGRRQGAKLLGRTGSRDRVEAIIDRYLQGNRNLRLRLKEYALAAKQGQIQ